MNLTPELQTELLAELEAEKKALETQIINLTPEVTYDMSQIVRTNRKNHLGVFDSPLWPSGHEKVWSPITELWDETTITAVDLDSKDITAINTYGKYYAIYKLWILILKAELKRMGIGRLLNKIARRLVIDGTGYAKVSKRYSKKHKKTIPDIIPIDFFNIQYDYTVENLVDSPIYEDFFPTQTEVEATDWDNKDKVIYHANVSRLPDSLLITQDNPDNTPKGIFTDVWKVVSKKFLTGDDADKDSFVEAHIVVSNLNKKVTNTDSQQESVAQIHKIEENPYKNEDGTYDKPYRAFPMREVIGRHPGRGMAEALQDIQLHANLSINWRMYGNIIRNSLVAKYNPGTTGLKPGDLSKLGPTGEIPITGRMDDFQFIQMPQAPDSQGEFNQIMDFAQRYVPSISQGVASPGEKPTTSLIRNQNATGLFGQIKEDFGLAVAEMIESLIVPIIIDNLETELTITGSQAELDEYDEIISELRMLEHAAEFSQQNGFRPSDTEQALYKDQIKAQLQKYGEERPITIHKAMKNKLKECAGYFTIAITDESIDKAVMASKLQEVFAVLAQANPAALQDLDPERVLDQIFNVLNIPLSPLRHKKPQMTMSAPGGQMTTPTDRTALTGQGNPSSEAANAGLPPAGAPLTSQVIGAV